MTGKTLIQLQRNEAILFCEKGRSMKNGQFRARQMVRAANGRIRVMLSEAKLSNFLQLQGEATQVMPEVSSRSFDTVDGKNSQFRARQISPEFGQNEEAAIQTLPRG